MQDIATDLEEAFRRIGEQLGRQLAERLLAARGEETGPAVRAQLRPVEPARNAKILPGLTGRRRRPGEAPPRCGRAGCNKASRTRGYCQTHYVQWLKAGERQRKAG